ncbi:MAG: hypothetical protein JXQ90_17125 [Cyclobacteriaceae bacterium]
MRFIDIKNITRAGLIAIVGLFGYSCADPNLSPVLTFEDAAKGAYPRLLDETDKLINLFDVSGSAYTYSIEFVDENNGNDVAEYILELTYDDNDASNGDNSVSGVELRRYSASDFSDVGNGFQGLSGISVSANDVIAAAGITEADVSAGDDFIINGKIITVDGLELKGSNSSSSVNGAAFRGHFDYTLPAACPSDLGGTYPTATNPTWCGNAITFDVEIQALGGGEYTFSDWSFGGYPDCYGGGAAAGLRFKETCGVVAFTAFIDGYGDLWEVSSSISGNDWIIDWDNAAWGERGVTTITFPGPVPFTLE